MKVTQMKNINRYGDETIKKIKVEKPLINKIKNPYKTKDIPKKGKYVDVYV